MIGPQTLFGRTALVIAVVSFAFQMFTLAVVAYFALLPLGRQATDDLAALMMDAAQSWVLRPAAEQTRLQDRIGRLHRIQIQDPPLAASGFSRQLPYFQLLEAALGTRAGSRVELLASSAGDGEPWYWADLPAAGSVVRVGFPASRIDVQPWLAMLLILAVGTLVTLVTSTWLAHRLTKPLSRLSVAARSVGRGQRLDPLPETGPAELATLARAFNRMAEQVEELLANRTILLAGISHDLRTPLTRIQLSLGMLSEKFDPMLLDRTCRDVEGMNRLIARCLEIGRDFSEKDAAETSVCELVEEVVAGYRGTAPEIHCRCSTDQRLHLRPLSLKRILANLVDNARYYGAGEPVEIEHGIGDGQVEIRIMDRGLGIPDGEREKLFRPFYRLEQSRSTQTGGSGLGLAIVRQLATANGWGVELAAREGGGTVAAIRIPLS